MLVGQVARGQLPVLDRTVMVSDQAGQRQQRLGWQGGWCPLDAVPPEQVQTPVQNQLKIRIHSL